MYSVCILSMYSINVPVIKSVKFTHRFGGDDREYVIVESDYDPSLGLLISKCYLRQSII
jgi:hypothetical protein